MLHTNTIDDVVLALEAAPINPHTGNKTLYSVDWVADKPTMIGEVNEDWVRRELDWFAKGSDRLKEMEGPVPKLFKACAGSDPEQRVNSAYGHILFSHTIHYPYAPVTNSLFDDVRNAFLTKGLGTRHAVAIISDRDIHRMSTVFGRNDFICTNALNFMVDEQNKLHIIAQMRSMDAVFGYRADWSMWNWLMDYLLGSLELQYPELRRGNITFQVANLHVYPRHLELLAEEADRTDYRLQTEIYRNMGGSLL